LARRFWVVESIEPVNRLFAPWRLEVIEQYKKTTGCILCELMTKKPEAEAMILKQSTHAYVVMNKYPYSNGHLMFVPNRHVGNWEDLNSDELVDLHTLSQKAVRIAKSELSCENFNLGANLGKDAGAGIPGHVHLHLVPRWPGDHNFMPVLGETKVISEHLEATYQKLKSAWEKTE